jgi:hypothetical protein
MHHVADAGTHVLPNMSVTVAAMHSSPKPTSDAGAWRLYTVALPIADL